MSETRGKIIRTRPNIVEIMSEKRGDNVRKAWETIS